MIDQQVNELMKEVKFMRQDFKDIKKMMTAQVFVLKDILNEIRRKPWQASTETKAAE